MPIAETQRLMTLVDKRLECLTRLCDIGRRQMESVVQNDFDTLLGLLDQKQRWLLLHQRLLEDLRPFLSQAPEGRHWRNSDDRDRCRENWRRCETLFEQIVQQESTCEEGLKRRRNAMASEAQTAIGALASYMPPASPTGARLDLTSET